MYSPLPSSASSHPPQPLSSILSPTGLPVDSDSSVSSLSFPSSSSAPSASPPQRNENIIVAVRVRPFDHKELLRGDECAWRIDTSHNAMIQTHTNTRFHHAKRMNTTKTGGGKKEEEERKRDLLTFQCGNLFSPETQTHELYNRVVYDIVDSAMKGVNGTIFAYVRHKTHKTQNK